MENKHIPNFNFLQAERKWQEKWEAEDLLSFDSKDSKEKKYVLVMLPYPSGNLHVGHLRNYTIGDIVARYKKMNNYNVLNPMGWDSFGLPAENAARQNHSSPKDWTYSNIATMKRQEKSLGLVYDWSKEIVTCSPDYYKHQQLLFIEMYNHGIIYRNESLVNWDPVDETVLANEQVVDGKGWRSGAEVEQKKIEQWFARISDFSEDLINDLDKLTDWPEKVKTLQKKWIGKSSGCEINFELDSKDTEVRNIVVYTTRPDTIFGSSALIISPNHPFALELSKKDKKIADFIRACELDDIKKTYNEEKDKKGIFLNKYSNHPLVKHKKLPIYIGNFVKMEYGTGAIFCCPANDERDLEFALVHNLDINPVVLNNDDIIDGDYQKAEKNYLYNTIEFAQKKLNIEQEIKNLNLDVLREEFKIIWHKMCESLSGDILKIDPALLLEIKKIILRNQNGVLVNSGFLTGLSVNDAKDKIITHISSLGIGKEKINYKLRDWGISRQRYWGCPIPMIKCEKCGTIPEKKENLPIILPEDVDLDCRGNPLDHHKSWKYIKCHKCGSDALRETDTLDTFFDSSWCFLRYPCATLEDKPFDSELINKLLPIDEYIGGIEHAILHLLYARFFVKALKKIGLTDQDEPFKRLITQGMVCHRAYQNSNNKWINPSEVVKKEDKLFDKDGIECFDKGVMKMSKSKLNVVDPEEIVKIYGADAARLFIISDTPIFKDMEWSYEGLESSVKYINKTWKMLHKINALKKGNIDNDDLSYIVNVSIKNCSDYLDKYELNRAVAQIHMLSKKIEEYVNQHKLLTPALENAVMVLIQLLYPVVPHFAEEAWQLYKQESRVSQSLWPKHDESKLIMQKKTIGVQVNGKLVGTIDINIDDEEDRYFELAKEIKKVDRLLKDGTLKRKIVIKNKILNLIIQ